MPLADWKKDALKALKREFNAIAAAMKLKTISGNPSHKSCAAMQKKLLQKQQSPATLQRINDAWAAYTRCLAGDHAGVVGGGDVVAQPAGVVAQPAQPAGVLAQPAGVVAQPAGAGGNGDDVAQPAGLGGNVDILEGSNLTLTWIRFSSNYLTRKDTFHMKFDIVR